MQYFMFIVTNKSSFTYIVKTGFLLVSYFSLELSSNPPLATILIPPHARIQAAASTPTNATAASGENISLFYKNIFFFFKDMIAFILFYLIM